MFWKLLLRNFIVGLLITLGGCTSTLDDVLVSYEKITSKYEQLLAQHPDNFNLRLRLAAFYYKFRDYEKVEVLLSGVENRQAKELLAKTFVREKKYNQALDIFERLSPLPQDNEYLYLYAMTLEEKNLFPRALKVYKKVKGEFADKAQKRIQQIKVRAEKVSYPKEIIALIKQAEDFRDHQKKEAAIIYLVDEKMEVFEDNRTVSTVHVIEQVLQERGKSLAEVEMSYDSTYERVELVFARTATPDGKVIYAGKENIRDVSKYLNYPLYSNARAFIVSMPSVEVGSVIEYKMKIYASRLVAKDRFSFLYRLRERYPIYRAKFELKIPKSFSEPHFKVFNASYATGYSMLPEVVTEGTFRVYQWKFEKVTPIIPEASMPPTSEINPAVLVSNFSSWEEVYRWWKKMFEAKTELTPVMKKFVDNLLKGASTDAEKAKRIYEFCARDIRYVAVEYGEGGYEPHPAKDVFLNRYGDCKDQATLLVALLRYAGLKAYPVLIPTREAYPVDEKFPALNFNHAIAAVELDGMFVFMDATAETTSFGYLPVSDQERPVMVFKNRTWQIITTPRREDNGVEYTMVINLDKDENARVTREVTTKGFFTAGHRWYLKYTHPSKIKENIQKKMVTFSPFARLLEYKILYVDDFDRAPLLKYTFVASKFLNPAGHLRVIPPVNEVGLEYALISRERRSFPVDFRAIYKKEARITINLPPNLGVKYLPDDVTVDTEWFSFHTKYTHKNNQIVVVQVFRTKKREVPVKEYKAFKKQMERVFYYLKEEIILERYGQTET